LSGKDRNCEGEGTFPLVLEREHQMALIQCEQTSLDEASDGQLVARALAGSEDAFEALTRRYSSQLFHFLHHFLHDYDSACDVLQQVMVRLYTALPTLHQERSLKAWLFTVAHHRAIDELRKERSVPFSELELAEQEENATAVSMQHMPLPQELYEYQELQAFLQWAMSQLPPHYREIVFLRYRFQLTFPEIGRYLGKPEATVKTYFHRARRRLRTMLEEERAHDLFREQ
jgi:RNA polymerase sigma factor (sigma-70 family)